jgi:hypothetical protein
MSKVLTIVSVFGLLMFSSFAHSASVDCSTPEGQDSAVKSYIANGGVVPACGPACSRQFVLDEVCPCATDNGRKALSRAFVASGLPVPACGPSCASEYILKQVCDGNAVKPSCSTAAGKEVLIKNYKGAVPACGPDCARGFILNQVCPAPTAPKATDSENQDDSASATSSGGTAAPAQ